MKKNIIMPLLSTICLAVVLGLLILSMYGWYVTNDKATVSNVNGTSQGELNGFTITFNNNKSANVLPGEITCVEMDIESVGANGVTLSFKTNDGWKDLEYSKATKYDSNEIYYSLNDGVYTLASGVNQTNYGDYYILNNIINKIYNDSSNPTSYVVQKMSLDKLYKIDNYYTVSNHVKGAFKYLEYKDKKEIFASFYKDSSYSISSKIKMYLTDTEVDILDYEDLIDEIEDGTSTKFKSITSYNANYNLALKDESENEYEKKIYCYLYFEKDDEVFEYSGSNTNLANTCFYGQNPYYFQTFNIDIFSSPNNN